MDNIESQITAAARHLDRTRFAKYWRAIGANDDAAFDVLIARYGEVHRAYHNTEHIAECLDWLNQVTGLAERPTELAVALYFHDVVYDPKAHDNEARSAALLRELAVAAGASDEAVSRIAALIAVTATHSAVTGDAALMNDIDLAILGCAPSRYARFERDIRREYSAFDDEAYRIGRAHVLRSFLERLRIYQTEHVATRLEAQARENIGRALAAIARGGASCSNF